MVKQQRSGLTPTARAGLGRRANGPQASITHFTTDEEGRQDVRAVA